MELIFPNVCGICGKLNTENLCTDCEELIKKEKINKIYNVHDEYLEKHIYIFKYKTLIRKMIMDYKFFNKSYLYKTFAKIIINDKKICDFINSYDIIIPVPIHIKRKRERGYNQSVLIAKKVVDTLNKRKIVSDKKLNLNINIIFKSKNTKKQSTLNKIQRKENVKNVYNINKKHIKEIYKKNILIFDDIYTTGSTAKECAKILKLYGANSVDVLTIAKK